MKTLAYSFSLGSRTPDIITEHLSGLRNYKIATPSGDLHSIELIWLQNVTHISDHYV